MSIKKNTDDLISAQGLILETVEDLNEVWDGGRQRLTTEEVEELERVWNEIDSLQVKLSVMISNFKGIAKKVEKIEMV